MTFSEKLTLKMNELTNKLSKVGDEFVDNSKNKEHAKSRLMNVYHGYVIFGNWFAVFIVLLSILIVTLTHQAGWFALLTLALVIPLAIRFSLKTVLRIDGYDYSEWLKKKKELKDKS